jgi:molecular chaperone GrpE
MMDETSTSEIPEISESEVSKIEPIDPELKQELKECKDKQLRLLAEFENTKKRLQKEKLEMTKFAVENVISEFLIPLDNLENALGFAGKMSDDVQKWAVGFQMIVSQFKEVLEQNGVHSFTSEGEKFDPHKHEAVEMEETSDCPEGTILKEFVKGYRCGDRIIRPARVKVAKSKL